MDAEAKSESYIDAARAVLASSTVDAEAYFHEAVAVASRICRTSCIDVEFYSDPADGVFKALLEIGACARRPYR